MRKTSPPKKLKPTSSAVRPAVQGGKKPKESKSVKEAKPSKDAKSSKDAKPKDAKPKDAKPKDAKPKDAKPKDAKKDPKAPAKAAAAVKDPPKKKRSKSSVVRLKAFWGVFNQMMKRVHVFEYSERRQADKKAAELSGNAKSPHFVQLVKEVIRDAE